MTTIEIPIRELHARTGHFVRKAAADMRVIITDNGKPVAEITPIGKDRVKEDEVPYFARRKLRPGFKIDEILDEVRADSNA